MWVEASSQNDTSAQFYLSGNTSSGYVMLYDSSTFTHNSKFTVNTLNTPVTSLRITTTFGDTKYFHLVEAQVIAWQELETVTVTTGWQDSDTTDLGTVTNSETRTVYRYPIN